MTNKYARGALLLLGIASAFAVAAALYDKTQGIVSDQHAAIVDRFGTLRELDAKIAQQTLAARHGLAAHYDPLTRNARSFGESLDALERELGPLVATDPELGTELAELEAISAERKRAVEQFKTQNSVLKNSLYYLPLAAQQVIDDLEGPESEARDASVEAAVAKLVQVTLAQNLLGGRTEAQKVEQQLALVEQLGSRVPERAQGRYRLLIAHAKTASRMQQSVDPILRKGVLDAPVAAKLAQLEQRYTQHFDTALEQASFYRSVLYGWSTLLLIAVLIAAAKLRSLYARLEKLVLERTQKLDQALKELWGEMELAKKIQTALVPRKAALRDCDVATVMRPADQVGGDYFDVFEVDGVEWVLIGDVSGHGVPAGLVMMMCQTSVRSVLAARPDMGPDELLTAVNRTLTGNIERLGEDKYMTISALRREQDGSFKMAGMHQDLLVYRARSRSVERLLAEGTWLGIASEIRELLPVRSVKLEPGDSLVLYTDGITEARRDDCMLEVEGLRASLEQHGDEDADGILRGILGTLADYEVNDDVAAIVIKQLEPVRQLEHSAA